MSWTPEKGRPDIVSLSFTRQTAIHHGVCDAVPMERGTATNAFKSQDFFCVNNGSAHKESANMATELKIRH